jgi:hypothetical protein
MNKKIIIIISVLILIFLSIFIYFKFIKTSSSIVHTDNTSDTNNNTESDDTTGDTTDNTNNSYINLLPEQYLIDDSSIIADNYTHIIIAKIKNIDTTKLFISKIDIIINDSSNNQFSTATCDLNITLDSNEEYEFHQFIDLPTDGKFVINYNVIGNSTN